MSVRGTQGNPSREENGERGGDNTPGGGIVRVVGIGPGSLDLIPPRSRDAIRHADTVIGYRLYIDLIDELIGDRTVRTSGPWDTQQRAENAVDLAAAGDDVTVVSSGDPGIYGMAAPILETASGRNVKVEVLPGITALCATASLLGSPLTADFAAISLSDHLIPWENIEERIHAAGEGNFVICLYNPRSEHRPNILSRTIKLLLEHRSEETPAAVVRNAYRDEETVRLRTLSTLDPERIDMLCTVIIGNSSTYYDGDRMITPREYSPRNPS